MESVVAEYRSLQNVLCDYICSRASVIGGDGSITMPFIFIIITKVRRQMGHTWGDIGGGRKRSNDRDDFLISHISTHVLGS